MKKILFATVAMAAAIVMGEPSSIESQNVVGYMGEAIENGAYNFYAPNFAKIDGTTITLKDIGVNEAFCFSTISFLAEDASTKYFELDGKQADVFSYYFEADLEGTAFEGKPGWYYVDDDAELHEANGLEVPFGSSFYVEGQDDDSALVFAGQVAENDQPVDLVNGVYNFSGNCSPVDLTLGDITVNENFCFSTISFLAEDASTKYFELDGKQADVFSYYFEADLEGTDFEGKPGWYYVDEDAELHDANSIPVKAGRAFYIEGQDDDAQVIIPTAL